MNFEARCKIRAPYSPLVKRLQDSVNEIAKTRENAAAWRRERDKGGLPRVTTCNRYKLKTGFQLAEQAAKRKREHGGTAPGKHSGKELPKCSDEGKATTQAAKLTGTNRTYVETAHPLNGPGLIRRLGVVHYRH